MKFCFGDIVIVEHKLIGVVVKSWATMHKGERINDYDVYVRNYNEIRNYSEDKIERYMVRHKELDEEELYYQNCVLNGI